MGGVFLPIVFSSTFTIFLFSLVVFYGVPVSVDRKITFTRYCVRWINEQHVFENILLSAEQDFLVFSLPLQPTVLNKIVLLDIGGADEQYEQNLQQKRGNDRNFHWRKCGSILLIWIWFGGGGNDLITCQKLHADSELLVNSSSPKFFDLKILSSVRM